MYIRPKKKVERKQGREFDYLLRKVKWYRNGGQVNIRFNYEKVIICLFKARNTNGNCLLYSAHVRTLIIIRISTENVVFNALERTQ